MDIAAASTIMSQSKLQADYSMLVMDKVMNLTKQNGNDLIQMMENSTVSTDPHLGKLVDKYV